MSTLTPALETALRRAASIGRDLTPTETRYLLNEIDYLRPQSVETVICSAIKTVEGLIVRGHRHGDCMRTASQIPRVDDEKLNESEQGFITSRNRFVDRLEGRRLQDAAGIPSVALGGYRGAVLFSEDLY